jgi:hypothetical protein
VAQPVDGRQSPLAQAEPTLAAFHDTFPGISKFVERQLVTGAVLTSAAARPWAASSETQTDIEFGWWSPHVCHGDLN